MLWLRTDEFPAKSPTEGSLGRAWPPTSTPKRPGPERLNCWKLYRPKTLTLLEATKSERISKPFESSVLLPELKKLSSNGLRGVAFGSGILLSKAAACGDNRFAGMMLFANSCRFAGATSQAG